MSDWISAGAAAIALLALVLGEVRAYRARKLRSERNIVDWAIDWPDRDAFVLTSDGPDEARNVLAKLTTEYVSTEVRAARVRRGDVLELPVPHLSSIWDSYAQRTGPIEIGVHVVQYGLRVTWESPRGTPQLHETSGLIQKNMRHHGTVIDGGSASAN